MRGKDRRGERGGERMEGWAVEGREGDGKAGEWREGKGKNDLTHPLSQIPGYATACVTTSHIICNFREYNSKIFRGALAL